MRVENPYAPPTSDARLSDSTTRISDELIDRLIEGRDVIRLAYYDVSDCQLYGSKYKRKLEGLAAEKADNAGCFPEVYQAIDWLCLVYIPIWPLGTYVVMEEKVCDDPDGDADQYRCLRVPTDVKQIASHYFSVAIIFGAVSMLVWCAAG